MVTWLQLTSILLVCLLSELENSSAFPRARSPVYPGTWQVLREKQKAGYNSGNRRPLQYIHARRQAHGKQQPNVHDPVQVKTWQNPQGSSLSYSQPQNQPGLYHQTQNSNHISLPQTPQRNPPLTMPRSFEFSLKVPFASSLGQSKETSQTTKGSDLNSDGSDGDSQSSQLYRPTSVQIHSSFNSPSGSDGFSGKGSTNDPNGGKNVHEVSKPSFQISLSVPIPSTTESPIPSSSNGNHFTNIKRPGTSGFVQNSYMEPSKLQSSSTQSNSEWILSDPGRPVQQQTQPQIYGPVHIQHTESKPVTYEKGHSGQTVSPNPANVHPVLSTSQDEMVPSGHYGAGQVKPTGDGYGQHQTWQPVGIQPTFASDVYGQNIKTGETDSGIPVQQQTEHQIFKPLHIKHTDSKPITFSPVYASQHAAPAEQISHGKIPTKQSQIFEKLVETPSLPIYHYPQQSENVYSGYYTALTNPTSTNYEKGQRGQTLSSNPANVHPVLSTLQYEMVPSGHYGAGQTWQPVGLQPTFASDGHGQNVERDSGRPVQQQTEHQLYVTDGKQITFSSGYASQYAAPTEQASQGKIPPKQSQIFEKLVQTPSLPIYHYPQQSDNVYSGYHTVQTNPTSTDYEKGQSGQTVSPNRANVNLALPPSQYERVPSGHYSAGHVKPSGNNYEQHQTWHPVGIQPTFAYDSYRQNIKSVSHSSPVQSLSPTVAPSQYELSSFSHNREIATTTDYGTGNMAQMGQTDFSSSSHQYSRGQSGQDALPNHPTAFHSLPNLQDLSSQYQTQMRLPGKETGKGQINKNPSYTKLFIDVEDVVDGSHGQNNFAAPIMHFDGYSGQNMGETLISNTNPLLAKLQSQISVSQGRLTGLLSSTIETSPRNKPNSYMPFSSKAPIMGSGVGQYASYPQEQRQTQQSQTSVSRQVNMAPHVGANTVQQFPQPMDYAPLKQISNTNFAPSVAAYQY